MWNITKLFSLNWRFMLQLQWAAPLNFSVMWQWSLTFSSSLSMSFSHIQQMLLDWNCSSFFTHDQIFVKMFFHYFLTIQILYENFFNKLISSLFTSINNYWLDKSIINTKKLVSKTTRNVILILFWVSPFNSQQLLNYTENHHKF